MEFKPEKVEEFKTLFGTIHDKIASVPGCCHVELCQDSKLEYVFYTFSRWESEEDLDAYRRSELFEGVWAKTKKMFGGKPLAYSLKQEQ